MGFSRTPQSASILQTGYEFLFTSMESFQPDSAFMHLDPEFYSGVEGEQN
jgi:hypothetical protein